MPPRQAGEKDRKCSACADEGYLICAHVEGAPRSSDPLIGQLIDDKYLVLEVIGRGAWGHVYKAEHELLKRNVAVKVLATPCEVDPLILKRFQREAEVLSKLDHPNICRIYDFVRTDAEQPCIVMELLSGVTLQQQLTQGPMPFDIALRIALSLASALEAAHSEGIIHRDLKPANIFLTRGGDVKILDFGLARIQQSTDVSLTETGHTVGTPLYMSPEQCRGEKVSAAADVYSFGCVFYEVLSGRPTFAGGQTFEIMKKQVTEKPQPLARILPHNKIPAKFEAIIFKCLQKEAEDRYKSGKELGSALAALAADLNIIVDSKSTPVLGQPSLSDTPGAIKVDDSTIRKVLRQLGNREENDRVRSAKLLTLIQLAEVSLANHKLENARTAMRCVLQMANAQTLRHACTGQHAQNCHSEVCSQKIEDLLMRLEMYDEAIAIIHVKAQADEAGDSTKSLLNPLKNLFKSSGNVVQELHKGALLRSMSIEQRKQEAAKSKEELLDLLKETCGFEP